MKTLLSLSIVMVAFSCSKAFAGRAEAQACAAELPKPAQVIFAEISKKLQPAADVRKLMRSTVTGLVRDGKIKRREAKSSAEAAGQCLRKLRG